MSSVEHFYQSIPGNFTFEDLYKHIATIGPRGVEIGVANGRSAAFLAVEMVNRPRDPEWRWPQADPHLILVDNSAGNLESAKRAAYLALVNRPGSQLDCCLSDSAAAATEYVDASLDFVFIDGDHSYNGCLRDIKAWLPKVRPGGILAGHDYVEAPWSGVIRAVTECFDKIEVWRGSKWDDGNYYPSWLVRI